MKTGRRISSGRSRVRWRRGSGPDASGQTNEGINISAPAGTPVRAAAAGTVIYAGNELQAFGNLLLIRHEGGWVTAYGHLDTINVQRGATVTQGETIGTVGQDRVGQDAAASLRSPPGQQAGRSGPLPQELILSPTVDAGPA